MKNNKKTKAFTVVSLFSGCGGLDLGFTGGFKFLDTVYEQRNFDLIWANDIDKNACYTFQSNLEKPIICGDIRDILDGKYPTLSSTKLPESADVVTGGFPCQDFSLAGKRRGFDSKRGTLYKSMVEVVRKLKPALFLAENVKGLLSMNNGQAIETIKNDFAAIGYDVEYKLFHVADYGVPQNRQRVIIIGTNIAKGLPKFEFPKPIYPQGEWLTLEKVIGDLEDSSEGLIENHYWSKAKMFEGTQGNTAVSRNKIGPTMRAEHHGNIEWHWNKQRRLSAREAARIQTFPDNFIFYPSTSSAYKQIGNAVPPVFGWHLATAIELFLENNL